MDIIIIIIIIILAATTESVNVNVCCLYHIWMRCVQLNGIERDVKFTHIAYLLHLLVLHNNLRLQSRFFRRKKEIIQLEILKRMQLNILFASFHVFRISLVLAHNSSVISLYGKIFEFMNETNKKKLPNHNWLFYIVNLKCEAEIKYNVS